MIIILFPGLNGFSVSVSKLPFMKLNPRYTGGEVAFQIIEESCTLDVRKPFFNGLLKERNSGFVQLEWRGKIPEMIKDSIDYNCDGRKDFYSVQDEFQEADSRHLLTGKLTENLLVFCTAQDFGFFQSE